MGRGEAFELHSAQCGNTVRASPQQRLELCQAQGIEPGCCDVRKLSGVEAGHSVNRQANQFGTQSADLGNREDIHLRGGQTTHGGSREARDVVAQCRNLCGCERADLAGRHSAKLRCRERGELGRTQGTECRPAELCCVQTGHGGGAQLRHSDAQGGDLFGPQSVDLGGAQRGNPVAASTHQRTELRDSQHSQGLRLDSSSLQSIQAGHRSGRHAGETYPQRAHLRSR